MKKLIIILTSLILLCSMCSCAYTDIYPQPAGSSEKKPKVTEISKEDLEGYWEAEFDISEIINGTFQDTIGKLIFKTDIGIDLGLEFDIEPIDLYIHFENDEMKFLIVGEQYTDVIKDSLINMLESLKESGAVYGKFLSSDTSWGDTIDSVINIVDAMDHSDLSVFYEEYTESGIFFVLNDNDTLSYEIDGDTITAATSEGTSFDMKLKRDELTLVDDEESLTAFKEYLELFDKVESFSESLNEEIADLEFEKTDIELLEKEYGAIE